MHEPAQAAARAPVRIGLIGGRGYVGAELIALLARHPNFELALVASRELAGTPVAAQVSAYTGALAYSSPDPDALATQGLDALVLALPNGASDAWVAAAQRLSPAPVLLDLSADHRFDSDWFYGLPELTRRQYRGQRRISNPGCYATAMQLAIAPVQGVLEGAVQCFGVSGYSGAGTSPSDKNNPDALRDNLIPYALAGHVHEREVSQQLAWAVEFMPHVAPHFRGLSVTANLHLQRPWSREELSAHFRDFYAGEPLVEVTDDMPWLSHVAGRHVACVGGFTVAPGGRRAVLVSVLDNLLKGAASQALQNLNLAFGFDEFEGLGVRSNSK